MFNPSPLRLAQHPISTYRGHHHLFSLWALWSSRGGRCEMTTALLPAIAPNRRSRHSRSSSSGGSSGSDGRIISRRSDTRGRRACRRFGTAQWRKQFRRAIPCRYARSSQCYLRRR